MNAATSCPTCGKCNPKRLWGVADDETVKRVSRVCVVCRAVARVRPGSTEAVAEGCTCPPEQAAILIRLSCPVHIPLKGETS